MEYNELGGAARPAMTPTASKWGFYIGLSYCIFFAIEAYFLGKTSAFSTLFSFLSFVLSVILTYMGQKAYRDTFPDVGFSYGKGVKLGIYQGLFATIVFTAFFVLFVYVLRPGYVESLQQAAIDVLQKQGIDGDIIEQSMRFTKMFYTRGFLVFTTLTGTWFSILFASLIASAFSRKEKNVSQQ